MLGTMPLFKVEDMKEEFKRSITFTEAAELKELERLSFQSH
jgi:hypothetical protein